MQVKKQFIGILGFFITLLFLPMTVAADTIDDLTKLWPEGATQFYHTYASIPSKVKALFPSEPKWNEYPTNQAYTGYGKQCTWYAYYRAKQQGRKYGEFEGNGGFWHEPAGGTTGDSTPKAQVAASITGGGNYLGAYGPYGHVIYVEYIDKQGNLLISEGNVRNSIDGGGTGGDLHENVRIIRKKDPNFDKIRFVNPANAKDLKDHGKNPDGSSVSADTTKKEDDKKKETAKTDTTTTGKIDIDDTFTVNGFGSTLGRDWNENDLSQNIPDASTIMSLSSKQRQALADWVAEYNTTKTGTIVSSVRTLVQAVGVILIFLTIALVFAYLFDRIGVLDFSMLYTLTGGKLYTVYETSDDTFFAKASKGKSKGVGLRSLLVLIVVILTLAIFIFTGKLYEYVYILITFVNDIVDGILSLI